MENHVTAPEICPPEKQDRDVSHREGGDASAGPGALAAQDAAFAAEVQGSGIEEFVAHFTDEIASRYEHVKQQEFPEDLTIAFRAFLTECAEQAKARTESPATTAAKEKELLLDLLLRIGDANQRLRRSTRARSSYPVWLRREDPGRTWEEETWTSTVSEHGAGFVCKHAVDVGGLVVLCRRDKGNRSQARVVYSRMDAEGRRQIGVEFLDQGDFWGLNRTAPV